MDSKLPSFDGGEVVAETEHLVFRRSPIHGTGGFARIDIASGAQLIEYVGEKITKAESLVRCEKNNEFIFELSEEEDLDGNVPWNPARFLNHSCAPNCEAVQDDGHIWIYATRDIRAGEEVTFNYGYEFTDYKEHPCRCGATGCVGYIVAEEYFDTIRRLVS